MIFAHAHNLIGVLAFGLWRRRAGRLHLLPLGLFALGCVLILLGAGDPLIRWAGAPEGLGLGYHLSFLAPGLEGPLAARLVVLFTFVQSAHYITWLRLVPEEDRPRETPRTFAATLRVLRAELGAPLLAIAAVASLGVALWAVRDLFAARIGYLRAAIAHGHLEVAALLILLVEGRRPGEASRAEGAA